MQNLTNKWGSGRKLVPISELFQVFIQNWKNNYSPYSYTIVNEMLVEFRSRLLCLSEKQTSAVYSKIIMFVLHIIPEEKQNVNNSN